MSVIGKPIRSRATGSSGVITGITRDRLSVSFRYAGIVDLPIKKYEELLEVTPEVRDLIEAYRESVKRKRKRKVSEPQAEEMIREN
jgi:hypothetical protein